MNCVVCDSPTKPYETVEVLGKYQADFVECLSCSVVFTPSPNWLAEAYSRSITNSDIGLLARNFVLAKYASYVLHLVLCCGENSKFLDEAGGMGVFVRLMRDRGFDFRWSDRFTQNIFAQGFEGSLDQKYDAITFLEAIEHLPDPRSALDRILPQTQSFLCSTELLPEGRPKLKDWWYTGLDHGQHITFYTRKGMIELAKRYGMTVYHLSDGLHLWTRRKPSKFWLKLFRSKFCVTIVDELYLKRKRPSLLQKDFEELLRRK